MSRSPRLSSVEGLPRIPCAVCCCAATRRLTASPQNGFNTSVVLKGTAPESRIPLKESALAHRQTHTPAQKEIQFLFNIRDSLVDITDVFQTKYRDTPFSVTIDSGLINEHDISLLDGVISLFTKTLKSEIISKKTYPSSLFPHHCKREIIP